MACSLKTRLALQQHKCVNGGGPLEAEPPSMQPIQLDIDITMLGNRERNLGMIGGIDRAEVLSSASRMSAGEQRVHFKTKAEQFKTRRFAGEGPHLDIWCF